MEQPPDISSKLKRWTLEPVLMVRELFGVEPDLWQKEALEAFPTNDRGALKACKGPGKTALLSWMGWNFLLTRKDAKVICTSITFDNLKDGLWTEMAKWRAKSPLLQQLFDYTSSRITFKGRPDTWFASARSWPKDSDQNSQAAAMAGLHGDRILLLLDEVSDYPEGVFVAAEAVQSTDAENTETKLWCAGNPTRTEGPLYRVCTTDRHRWWVKEISADPDAVDRTPRVSKQWAQQQIDMWGRDNPYVLINVFGKFPPSQANKLINIDDVMKATQRVIPERAFEMFPLVMGIDVAAQGDDDTVFMARRGPVAYRPRVYKHLDPMEVADQARGAIEDWKPKRVFVDSIGIGAGVIARLRQLGYPVVDVHVGVRARDPARFENLRAELWWAMNDWLKNEGSIPNDAELIAGLTAPNYKFSRNMRFQLESKDDLRSHGKPSPDKADALAMTFVIPDSVDAWLQTQVSSGNANWDYDPMSAVRKEA